MSDPVYIDLAGLFHDTYPLDAVSIQLCKYKVVYLLISEIAFPINFDKHAFLNSDVERPVFGFLYSAARVHVKPNTQRVPELVGRFQVRRVFKIF